MYSQEAELPGEEFMLISSFITTACNSVIIVVEVLEGEMTDGVVFGEKSWRLEPPQPTAAIINWRTPCSYIPGLRELIMAYSAASFWAWGKVIMHAVVHAEISIIQSTLIQHTHSENCDLQSQNTHCSYMRCYDPHRSTQHDKTHVHGHLASTLEFVVVVLQTLITQLHASEYVLCKQGRNSQKIIGESIVGIMPQAVLCLLHSACRCVVNEFHLLCYFCRSE